MDPSGIADSSSHHQWLRYLTFQDRAELTYEGHAPGAEVLADGHLLEEDGDAAEDHGDEVDNQKRTWS